MDTAERIFTRMKEIGLEQKLFATQVGVSPQKVSEWKLGKAKSYTKYLPQIAEALGVSAQYLLTGEDPKNKTAPTNVPDLGTFSTAALDVASAYDAATPELQAAVRRVLGLM